MPDERATRLAENEARFREITDIEDVVERTERFFLIRKHPETWEIVHRTDPRS